MCSIFGALVTKHAVTARADYYLRELSSKSFSRGRDGAGYAITGQKPVRQLINIDSGFDIPCNYNQVTSVIGNFRAEPTTEFVNDKKQTDQQPYNLGKWSIVHNGTIANDKALRNGRHPSEIDSTAIVEVLDELEREAGLAAPYQVFKAMVDNLVGSFAILATHSDFPECIFYACNYRPIWVRDTGDAVYFGSSRSVFPSNTAHMIKPYTMGQFSVFGSGMNCIGKHSEPLRKTNTDTKKALVVCSGGLDSVTVASVLKLRLGYDVTLVHFTYGCRAEGPEVKAVKDVAEYLGVPLLIKEIPAWDKEDSPLLNGVTTIADGESGAEFAHEWVPARNTVMLAMATAYAEAKGFDYIALGNNMEEAGAYPDNEPEFIDRFNDLLDFSVGANKSVKILQPVGNLMKHEIVALGKQVGAPLHLTWSCYHSGEKHCGECGPCFMRKTAFEINNFEEVIEYGKSKT